MNEKLKEEFLKNFIFTHLKKHSAHKIEQSDCKPTKFRIILMKSSKIYCKWKEHI